MILFRQPKYLIGCVVIVTTRQKIYTDRVHVYVFEHSIYCYVFLGTNFEAKNSGTTSHDEAKQADNQEAPDLYATVDVVTHSAAEGATMVTGMEQNNEYDDLICTSSPAGLAAASTASNPPPPGDSFIYSEVSEPPREGEVYNVAYPVNTFNRENLNETVDGYECLSTK